MATKKPRILITIDDDLNDKLFRLSKLLGSPKATLVTEMLKNYELVIDDLISALEQIKDNKENAPSIVREFSRNMLIDANEMMGELSKDIRKL